MLPSLSSMKASLARDSLRDFIFLSWHLVEPTTPLVWNWHLDELCSLLESITASKGHTTKTIINIPPGCMKSLLVSVLWPAWEWASDPSLRYLTVSYTDVNTIRDNRRLRSIVKSNWYRTHYGVELASDQSAKIRFDTTAKGWRIATSVEGMGTGEHPDRIIIDDPLKADDGRSRTKRKACISWYKETISTRVARDPAIIVIMQRLHEEDLSGYLLSEESGWQHVRLPMRYNSRKPDPIDHRTSQGQLLWPEKWSEEKVIEEEISLGEFGRAGQLQQEPIPEGGALFKREWFPIVESLPTDGKLEYCRGWDTAATESETADWTAGVKIARHRTSDSLTYYICDVVRVRVEEADKIIKQTAITDGKKVAIREEQEPGSSGKAIIKSHARSLAGYDYAGVTISGDKATRARPFRTQAEAKNVRLLKGEWNSIYLNELCSFPNGLNDDQVDGTSCAFNSIEDQPKKQTRATWGRGRKDK